VREGALRGVTAVVVTLSTRDEKVASEVESLIEGLGYAAKVQVENDDENQATTLCVRVSW